MRSVPATLQGNPWYRFLRCLVLLYVAALERRIARLLAEMDALPEDPRFDAEFARLDDRCHGLECLRDAYLAWLADPLAPMPRMRDADFVVRNRRWAMARSRRGAAGGVGRRVSSALARGGGRRGRRRCALLPVLDRPGGGDGAWAVCG